MNVCVLSDCFLIKVREFKNLNDHVTFLKYGKYVPVWGMCGTLVESMPFDRRVVGSNPALAAT